MQKTDLAAWADEGIAMLQAFKAQLAEINTSQEVVAGIAQGMTIAELRALADSLDDEAFQNIPRILERFGAKSFPDLNPSEYGAVAEAIRGCSAPQ